MKLTGKPVVGEHPGKGEKRRRQKATDSYVTMLNKVLFDFLLLGRVGVPNKQQLSAII